MHLIGQRGSGTPPPPHTPTSTPSVDHTAEIKWGGGGSRSTAFPRYFYPFLITCSWLVAPCVPSVYYMAALSKFPDGGLCRAQLFPTTQFHVLFACHPQCKPALFLPHVCIQLPLCMVCARLRV